VTAAPGGYSMDRTVYDAYIVLTPADFERLSVLHERLLASLPAERIYFVGRQEVGDRLAEEIAGAPVGSALALKAGFIDENSIIDFDSVHKVVSEIVSEASGGQKVERRVTGWYYQQFLKFALANHSSHDYYLVWDGDTVPCGDFSMFSDDGIPFLDTKSEYHEEYFNTLSRLFPGMEKVIKRSFIAEHMLFRCSTVRALTGEIEKDERLTGESFWERILRSMNGAQLMNTGFSEFETYGTYVSYRCPDSYRLREWHSLRYGGIFFDPNKISESDYRWLYNDFGAISFEKNHQVRDDTRGLFDNPRYQEKLSARQILEMVQQEFSSGEYMEEWGDDPDSGK
jgi:hypothetical protein